VAGRYSSTGVLPEMRACPEKPACNLHGECSTPRKDPAPRWRTGRLRFRGWQVGLSVRAQVASRPALARTTLV